MTAVTDDQGRSDWRSPVTQAYLESLRAELSAHVAPGEISTIVLEIDNHIAEATRQGSSSAAAIRSLGSPGELAEAYGVALTFEPSPGQGRGRWRATLRGVAATARLAAYWLLQLLGSTLALALALSGTAAVFAALLLPLVPPRLLDPTLRAGLPQLVVLTVGVACLALAVQIARWLRLYARLSRRRPPTGAPEQGPSNASLNPESAADRSGSVTAFPRPASKTQPKGESS